jgi:16S rRNA (guanine966-N2)-methyltransferase
LRIISGQFRGRKLQSFKGKDVRPTADRIRESMFNIIADRVVNASILDLFAGTGALGIEAISRGAQMAVFVDGSAKSLSILRKNIHLCHLIHCTRTVQWDISKNLHCLKSYATTFDLIFLDPPYNKGLVALSMRHLIHSQCLADDTLLIAEHEVHLQPVVDTSHYIWIDTRRYGRTALSFYSFHSV